MQNGQPQTMTTMTPNLAQNSGGAIPPQDPNGIVASNQPGTNVTPKKELDVISLVKTIAIVTLTLTTLVFIGLFIWKQMQYDEARTDVDGQIAVAVAEAKIEQAEELEAEFTEREKYPYSSFVGPVDYGQLSFQYPKTWSVYVAADASNGGDFQAYLNPGEVNTVGNNTINALRVIIRDKDFDQVAAEYQRYLDNKQYNIAIQTITVAGTTANLYTGTIPNSELEGYIVIFKIRDKTAVLQTDSMLFHDDFFNIVLDSVEFNA